MELKDLVPVAAAYVQTAAVTVEKLAAERKAAQDEKARAAAAAEGLPEALAKAGAINAEQVDHAKALLADHGTTVQFAEWLGNQLKAAREKLAAAEAKRASEDDPLNTGEPLNPSRGAATPGEKSGWDLAADILHRGVHG